MIRRFETPQEYANRYRNMKDMKERIQRHERHSKHWSRCCPLLEGPVQGKAQTWPCILSSTTEQNFVLVSLDSGTLTNINLTISTTNTGFFITFISSFVPQTSISHCSLRCLVLQHDFLAPARFLHDSISLVPQYNPEAHIKIDYHCENAKGWQQIPVW